MTTVRTGVCSNSARGVLALCVATVSTHFLLSISAVAEELPNETIETVYEQESYSKDIAQHGKHYTDYATTTVVIGSVELAKDVYKVYVASETRSGKKRGLDSLLVEKLDTGTWVIDGKRVGSEEDAKRIERLIEDKKRRYE